MEVNWGLWLSDARAGRQLSALMCLIPSKIKEGQQELGQGCISGLAPSCAHLFCELRGPTRLTDL